MPFVHKDGQVVELSRLCFDEPCLSLTTPQGLLMWKVIRTLWIYRCAVLFKGENIHLIPFMAMLRDGLKWWTKEEVLAVPVPLVTSFLSGVEGWLAGTQPSPNLSLPFPMGLVQRKRKRKTSGDDSSIDPPRKIVKEGWKTVYTDGSFSWETVGIGFAGSGYCVEDKPEWDSAMHLPGELQTNNRAELYALIMALQNLPREWLLHIISDSLYVVSGVKEGYGEPLAFRRKAKLIANMDLWEILQKTASKRSQPWEVEWTRGHVGLSGNEKADELANKGRLNHPSRLLYLAKVQGPSWIEW
jgi:ribonuclease HI